MQTFRYASLALVLAACSNSNPNNDGGTPDSGTDGTSGNTFNQTGQIVDYSSKAGLGEMVVSGGGNSVGTDSKGNYTLPVPKNTAYTMTIASAADASTGYLTLNEQEWTVSGDVNRGQTSAVSNVTENLLKAVLQPQPTASLAVFTVQVIATGACASSTGATISVPGLPAADAGTQDGGSGPYLNYFSGGFPSTSATSVTNGELPSAIVWNLPVTASFKDVTVTPPAGCTVVAFPTPDPSDAGPGPNLTYTGNVKLDPSSPAAGQNVASFMRVFLK
jgi:hypothetical protein